MSDTPAPNDDLVFYPDHPIWRSIDDDDWNGATLGNFLRTLRPEQRVVLISGTVHPKELVDRVVACVARHSFVRVQEQP